MSAALTTETVRWNDDAGLFEVTGYDEAAAVLHGTGWSSDLRLNPNAPKMIESLPQSILVMMDPPDHGRLRRLISPAFTPRASERVRPRIAAVVDSALSGLDQQAELMSEFAYLVPLALIAEFLDVGPGGAEVFLDHTPALMKMFEPDATEADSIACTDASIEIMLTLTPLLSQRKQHPGDDFISALLAQEDLTAEEIISTCIQLLIAGHETTANLIGNGTLALLREPKQRAHLFADPARAVEEILRVHGPIKWVGRTATTDQDLGGVTIPAGSYVRLWLDAANTDPRTFAAADTFDPSRKPQAHLAFGGGAHYCLGAGLARLEAAEALVRLFRTYPEITLATDDPEWRESTMFRSLDRLPVDLGR